MNQLMYTLHIILAVTTVAAVSISRENHECLRTCVSTNLEDSRICTYKFTIARAIHSSDRIFTEQTINGSSPGPPIEICLGDTIVVIVENKLASEEVSFHWHGLRHKGSPHMDGVPMISQCPIFPYTSFRYEFKPEKTGTYFYHAHEVRQQGDGLYGSLTVRGPGDDRSTEKILLVSARPSSPLSQLIRLEESSKPRGLLLNGQDKDVNINVESNRNYLLRLINANAFHCPITFSVDQHSLDVVACDGHSVIRGTTAKRIILFPGERFDVTLETNQTPGRYSVILQGLGDCRGLIHESFINYDNDDSLKSWQLFGDAPASREEAFFKQFEGETPIRNCHEGIFGDIETVCSLDLKGGAEHSEKMEEEELITEKIETYYIPFDVNSYNDINDEMTDYSFNIYGHSYYPSFLSTRVNATRVAQINRMTFEYPSSPISSQPELVADDTICSIDKRSESCNSNTQFFCQCTQILQLPAWRTVDIVLIDEGFGGNVSHTFHVHGYHANIIGVGEFKRPVLREEIVQLNNEGKLRLNNIPLRHSLQKDTFVVPNKGFIVLRIRTDNIGYWLWEARSTGTDSNGPPMQFVMLVGNRENLPTVPIDFPTCGNHKGPASIFEDND